MNAQSRRGIFVARAVFFVSMNGASFTSCTAKHSTAGQRAKCEFHKNECYWPLSHTFLRVSPIVRFGVC